MREVNIIIRLQHFAALIKKNYNKFNFQSIQIY